MRQSGLNEAVIECECGIAAILSVDESDQRVGEIALVSLAIGNRRRYDVPFLENNICSIKEPENSGEYLRVGVLVETAKRPGEFNEYDEIYIGRNLR